MSSFYTMDNVLGLTITKKDSILKLALMKKKYMDIFREQMVGGNL